MGIKFRYNDKTYELIDNIYRRSLYPEFKDNVSQLRVRNNNTVASEGDPYHFNAYASTEQGSKILVGSGYAGERIYIDNSSPTVHFRKDGKNYHCAKSWTLVRFYLITYYSNGGTGSMDSQTFYPDDGESVAIKANSFTRSGYSFIGWNTSSDGAGTAYQPAAVYKGSLSLSLYAQWKINFSAANWDGIYSSANTWKEEYSDNKIYKYKEHLFNFSVQVIAPSANVYRFAILSNSGNWTASFVSNPDIPMNGSTTKTMAVQVLFRSSVMSGDSTASLTIGLVDRTGGTDNGVVSQYSLSTQLGFGSVDNEE